MSFLLVQVVSLSKVAAAVAFASVSHSTWAIGFYLYAVLGDYLDGFLARRLGVASPVGAAFDTSGDKFLTIASAIYLVQRGVAPPPLLLILVRDVLLQALRAIWKDGVPVVPTIRWIGIATIAPMRLATLLIVLNSGWDAQQAGQWSWMFWSIAAISLASTGYTLAISRSQIAKAAGLGRSAAEPGETG